LSVDQLSVDQLSVYQSSVDQLSVNQSSVDQLPWSHLQAIQNFQKKAFDSWKPYEVPENYT
jgi:hypothetical protein